jgi:hypothetical protein
VGGSTFGSVSPARCAGSSLTYAERTPAHTLQHFYIGRLGSHLQNGRNGGCVVGGELGVYGVGRIQKTICKRILKSFQTVLVLINFLHNPTVKFASTSTLKSSFFQNCAGQPAK